MRGKGNKKMKNVKIRKQSCKKKAINTISRISWSWIAKSLFMQSST